MTINMNSNNKLEGIQALRGISALLVVLFHANILCNSFGKEPSLVERLLGSSGEIGVDIFFIISGFVIMVSTLPSTSLGEFFTRRIVRIVPLYWILTSFYLFLFLLLPRMFNSFQIDGWQVLTSYFFIPYKASNGVIHPVLSYGWSLNFELLFYALFGVFLGRRNTEKIMGVLAVYLVIYLIHHSQIFQSPFIATVFEFYSDSMFLEFIMGLILGKIYIEYRERLSNILPILTILSLCLYLVLINFDLTEARFVKYGLISLSAFSIFLFFDLRNLKTYFFAKLGDASYSLYLIQVFTLPVIWKTLSAVGVIKDLSSNSMIVISTLGSIIFAFATYYLIERPLQKSLRNINSKLSFLLINKAKYYIK